MITPNYDLDIDSTLGGDNASDYIIPSQKAIKDYVDNNTGSTVDQVYDPTSQSAQSGIAIAGANFLTSSDLTNYVTTNTDQNITGVKTFVGQKRIGFKQSGSSDKLGFTLYNNSNVEKGYLEFNPTNTIDGAPLMTLGNYASSAAAITHVGFRKYSSVSGASGAYNLLAPLISDARTPFNLTTTYTNFYLPLGFTDGTTTVTAAKTGLVNISSLLPDISGKQNTLTAGSNITISGDTISATDTTYSDFTGADSVTAGTSGLVPAPAAGDDDKILTGGASWSALKTINNTSLLGGGDIAALVNTATGTNSLSILGTATSAYSSINIGFRSNVSGVSSIAIGAGYGSSTTGAIASGDNAIAIGSRGTTASGDYSIAIGSNVAGATGVSSIQLGYGTNSTANTLSVGFFDPEADPMLLANYQLLDGTTGYIPNARINMDTVPESGSTNAVTSGAVYTALADKVNKSGDTMTGGLALNINGNSVIQNVQEIDVTSTPSTTKYAGFQINDKNGVRIGKFEVTQHTNGYLYTSISTHKNGNFSSISVGFLSDGTAYATAPQPPTTDIGSQIATTNFVHQVIKSGEVSLAANTATWVSFSSAFPNNNVRVAICRRAGATTTASVNMPFIRGDVNATGFNMWNPNSSGVTIQYIAKWAGS